MVVLGNAAAMSAEQSPNAIKVDEQDHYHGWLFDFWVFLGDLGRVRPIKMFCY